MQILTTFFGTNQRAEKRAEKRAEERAEYKNLLLFSK
jgi:hypothetical protein